MKRFYLLGLLFTTVLFSCTPGSESTGIDGKITGNMGEGGRVYGGVLRVNETEQIQTLYPHSITDFVSNHIAAQVHETLLRFDTKDLSLIPGIAESWEFDTSGTVLTFKIRKGVRFQNDSVFPDGEGREVKADDIKYTFTKLVTYHPDNLVFPTTFQDIVKGANEYYEASKSGEPNFPFEGVKVVDDYTVQIILETYNPTFLQVLTQPSTAIMSKELVNQYGNLLRKGAGPFIYTESGRGNEVILVKNPNYYLKDSLGNQLPLLDSVVVSFISEKETELRAFMEGKIDLIIGLPAERIKDVLENNIREFENSPPKYILDRSPELATHFYEFNTTIPVFQSKKVRQAFSFAIDRQRIVDDILKGEAYGPGIHGLIPPSLQNYDISKIQGYNFDPVKARRLLAEAGYAGGKGFPQVKLQLNSGGSRNTNVALEIQRQLREVLNVHIDLEIASFQDKLEDSQYGRGDLFRSAWIADYPAPESFLQLTYGKYVPEGPNELSYPNVSRYKSPIFDNLYEQGLRGKTTVDRNAYFALAEQVMMEDAPIIVLWYDEKFRLYQGDLRNFHSNPLNTWDFREVYKKKVSA